ncbi:hypothetical protein HY620_00030 [Candidatus Uhrbacteria bacterium]|nr:hypothetical protein [Candidatus Uhrbacteria bacterium]
MITIAFTRSSAQRDLQLQTAYRQAQFSARACAQYAIARAISDPAFSTTFSYALGDIQCSLTNIQTAADTILFTTTGTSGDSHVVFETLFDTTTKSILSQREQ